MSEIPLVSVIFPIERWDFLSQKALSSLKNQTYQAIEIIPVWCGSEKIGSEVLNCFPTGLHTAEESSIYEGMNLGIAQAKGSFVTFLTQTNCYAHDRIAKCVERLQLEEAECVFTQVHGIDEVDQTLPRDHFFWKWRQDWEFQSDLLPTVGFKLLNEMAPVSIGNVVFAKRLIDEVGSFTSSPYAAYDYLLRALLIAEPIFLKETLFYYRFLGRDKQISPEPFLIKGEVGSSMRKDYLLRLVSPPQNKLAPCHHYWPMIFSSFRIGQEMDAEMGQQLQEITLKGANDSETFTQKKKSRLGKVSLLIHDLSLSGAPRVAADLALALKENGYEPNVISFADGPLRAFFERHDIPISFISSRTRYWFFQKKFKKAALLLSMAWQMFKQSGQTTIAVASLTWPALFIATLAFPFRKFVWYLHDSYAPEGIIVDGLPFRLFQKCLARRNLRFWFGSNATRLIWENAEVQGKVVYWSGIPKNETPTVKKEALKAILSVGAGYPRKGAHFLLEAFLHCAKEKWIPDDVTLTIVGFSDSLQDLKDFVSDMIYKVHASAFAERIKLVKSIDEAQLDRLYDQCDLYVQPSFLECLPLAMLKAMSKGLPVITTHVDGCNEAIKDGENGFTCPPRNSLLLAKKLAEAVNQPQEAQRLGAAAKSTFNEKFSLEATKSHFFSALTEEEDQGAYTTCVTHNLDKKSMPLSELV
ncbi:hypothetical protein PHSC3_000842 [Chlamydiales bacterium STE3]|nr:hypothetical protein PHSC3_000842 [Chlamydiales bacterium STE3]